MSGIQNLLFTPLREMSQAIFIHYLDGPVTAVNQVACKLTGFSEAEILSLKLESFLLPDDCFRHFMSHIKEYQKAYALVQCRHQNGNLTPALIQSGRIEHREQTPLCLTQLTPLDVFEKRNQLQLDTAAICKYIFWEFDLVTGALRTKGDLADVIMNGHKPSKNIEEVLAKVADPVIREKVRTLIHDAAVYGFSWNLDVPLRVSPDTVRTYFFTCNPVFRNGSCIALSGMVQDIHPFSLNNKDHEQENTELRILTDAVNKAVTIRDKDLKLIYCNPYMLDLFGYTKEEFSQMNISELVYLEDQERTKKFVKDLISKRSQNDFQNRVITKSGRIVEMSWDMIWFPETQRYYALGRDITKQKQLMRQVERRVFLTQEAEKFDIYEDLHENICQIFAAAKIYISNYLNYGDPANLQNANELLASGIETTRALAAIHIFPELELQTFEEAVLSYFLQLNKRNKGLFKLKLKGLKGGDLPLEVKKALYRVLQDLSANVIQHSHATKAELHIIRYTDLLRIEFSDNGVGSDLKVFSKGRGFARIQAHVDQLGAALQVESPSGKGLSVIIELNLLKFGGNNHR